MDPILRLAWTDFETFQSKHLFAAPGASSFTLNTDPSQWDYSQLWNPWDFEWKVGVTPFSDLATIRMSWVSYFAVIMAVRWFMKDREAFKAKWFTALHSLFLCVASLGMFVSGAIGAYEIYANGGLGDVFVYKTYDIPRKGLMFWTIYIYYLSKFPELIDTVILVVKKKNVIFLHWYHHAIVILMVWTWLEMKVGFAICGLLFNTFVHVFMYWYYFASVLGWNVWFKKYITTIQIIQFICSFLVTGVFIHYAVQREFESWYSIYFSTAINFSFLLLFVNFYLQSYKANPSGDKKSVGDKPIGGKKASPKKGKKQ